jgi:hypothetical protein
VLGEALALAAANGQIEAMERLVERGAPVDGGMDDHSALHLAVTYARLDAARWLLERGADVDVRDRTRRWTPVAWSALWARSGSTLARRGGADRVAVRDLLVEATAAAARGNLPLAFEREWARWAGRGSAVLESGLRYGDERPVLVLVSKRPCRYSFSDRGGAVDAAGQSPRWHEAARAIEKEHGVNVSRNGVVFLPAVERRKLTWLETLPDRIAQASVALYGALLDLDG